MVDGQPRGRASCPPVRCVGVIDDLPTVAELHRPHHARGRRDARAPCSLIPRTLDGSDVSPTRKRRSATSAARGSRPTCPTGRLPSGDTREGFALHLRVGAEALRAPLGGRVVAQGVRRTRASLMEWLIFEEEYYRAGAPQRVTQNGIFLLAPTIFEFGTRGAEGPHPAADGGGRGPLGQGWSEPNAGSDLAGIQSKARATTRGRLAAQRSEDLVHPRRVLHSAVRSLPHRSRGRAPQGPHVLPRRRSTRPGVTRRGVDRLDGDEGFAEVFLDDVLRARRRRARRGQQGLGRRDGDHQLRARPHAAQPRSLHRDGDAPHRALHERVAATTRSGVRDRVVAGVDRCRGVPLVHLRHGHPDDRRASTSAPSRA